MPSPARTFWGRWPPKPELTDDVRRLLDAIFGEVVEVGAPGRAQLLRNTHTLPLAADLVSAIEAVALDDASARSVGALDADQIPLFSPVSADPVVQAVRQQRYTGDYTAEMLLAELSRGAHGRPTTPR